MQIIVVYIIDESGIIDTIKSKIVKVLTKGKFKRTDFSIKPFDCSLCMTFWCGLIYLLFTKFTLLGFMVVCLLSFLTSLTKNLFELIWKWITKIN